jgi:YggT family protein
MADEIRRETTEEVHRDANLQPSADVPEDALPQEPVITDPVSGEVVTTGPVETRVARSGPGVSNSYRAATYATDPYAARRLRAYRLQQAIYLVFGIIEALIAIRFVLELLAANPNAGFAQFIYGITAVFMAPFVGLFGVPQFGASVIEWSALVAIVVYALLAGLLARLAWIGVAGTRTATVTRTDEVIDRRER